LQGFRSTDLSGCFCLFVSQGQGVNVPLSTLKTFTLSFLCLEPHSRFRSAFRTTPFVRNVRRITTPSLISTCNTWLECVSSTLGFTSHYSPTHRIVSLHWFDSESFGLALRCMVMGHGLLVWGVCVRCFALCSTGYELRGLRFWNDRPTFFVLLWFAQLAVLCSLVRGL
jgi:hypothetical protein